MMNQSQIPAPDARAARHRVWDAFVRLFHWLLAASVTVALVSGFLLDASWIRLHLGAGTLAVILVVARIVWGFAGPTYARFAQFLPRPGALGAHLREQLAGAPHRRHVGHNPLGALMVVALLLIVLLLGATGLAWLGGGLKTGPLATFLPATQTGLWSETHETLAAVILGLIALHLGGVVHESLRSRENLARAMVTGCKEVRPGDVVAPQRRARPIVAAAVVLALLASGSAAVVVLSGRPLQDPPVAAADFPTVYTDECAACHMAYHPALRPAPSWQALMARLDDHFGEDAGLPDETGAEITAWLTAHSAETVDNFPASLWRDLPPVPVVALPDTPQWQELHENVDPALFRRRAVYSRSNCAACHRDAESGWLSPFAISIPEENTQ